MSTATFSPTSPRRETHNSAGLAFQNPGHRFVPGWCLLGEFFSFFVDFYPVRAVFNCSTVFCKFWWFLIQSDPKLWLEGLQSEPAKDTPGTMIINMERMKIISKIMIKGWWIDANSQHGSPGDVVALPCLLGPDPPSQYHRRLWSPGILSHGNGDADYWSLLVYLLWWWQIVSFSFQ